jgi:hypothetical protein
MNQNRNFTIVLGICVLLVTVMVFLSGKIYAGDLNPPGPPGPTMKTLDEIPPTWGQKLPASERFKIVMDGEAVLDKETGLVWQQNALGEWPSSLPLPPPPPPPVLISYRNPDQWCSALYIGGRGGWRGPTVDELMTLVDRTQSNPALPSGHPFSNVQSCYWTTTNNVAVDFTTGSAICIINCPPLCYYPYSPPACCSTDCSPPPDRMPSGEAPPCLLRIVYQGPMPPTDECLYSLTGYPYARPPSSGYCFHWCVRGQY